MIRIGISGWRYSEWRRGVFYPIGLPQRQELAYAASHFGTVELNGSFYSLQRPTSYRAWHAATPDDFVFAVKGGRFITHFKRLRAVDEALANFFASGPLALGAKLGPILWQLPERLRYDADLLESFLDRLPATAGAAADLALRHGPRLEGRAFAETDCPERPIRHAIEPRHDSFFEDPSFAVLLRRKGVAFVVADTAGRWRSPEGSTADFAYVRLHGARQLYTGAYDDDDLDRWATRIRAWSGEGRDVYVYFDNDIGGFAPHDALRLARRCGVVR